MPYPKLTNALDKFILWLQKVHAKLALSIAPGLPYTPLSATDNAENVNEYLEAIDWAVLNRKKYGIYNVALTGPYGSGKSSVLKTYMATRKGKGHHFLPISLATFREEKRDSGNTDGSSDKNELLRLIELSILQQIFYHEDDRRIPDSRFRKIKHFSWIQLTIYATCLVLFLAAFTQLFFPDLIINGLKLEKENPMPAYVHWVSLLLFVAGMCWIIYRSIRLISSLHIEKLTIHNAEINIDKGISKSILNHHLDEILYFFEVTKYDVVIIEDLDRFRETDIFTKLREINLLINNSKKIKREIVFIYAVRDDMFREDNERTKFFEFIIPVIPIINSNNSSQKLLAKALTHGYTLSENIIDSISSFIDDMRLLHNITNEFYLYREKLNPTLTQDHLLALIVYKNLFPNDFAQLSNNKGRLFEVFSVTKKQLVKDRSAELTELIRGTKARIEELDQIVLNDLKELRYTYVLHYVAKRPGFVSFVINGSDVQLMDMAEETNFQRLMQNGCNYKYNSTGHYDNTKTIGIPITFNKIEKEVNGDRTYKEREKDLIDIYEGRQQQLKRLIADKERDLSDLRKRKMRELLAGSTHVFKLDSEKQSSFVSLLIRNGFIDENYHDYISLFYEGSISKTDHQFLINVKTQQPTPFDYVLSKTDNLIGKINMYDFDKPYIYNYQLLDTIIVNSSYADQFNTMVLALSNEDELSILFIDGYLDQGKEPGLLIQQLVNKWKGIWDYLDGKSQYTDERKKKYFRLIIANAKVEDISTLFQQRMFQRALYSFPDFLSIIDDKDRLKKIIKQLDLKFVTLDQNSSPDDLLGFVYEGNHYAITPSMLALMLKVRGAYNELNFTTKNYHAVNDTKAEILAEYIHNNLSNYVSKVYLSLSDNKEEPEEDLVDLLNQESLSEELLSGILNQTNTVVSDLVDIISVDTKLLVLGANKMAATWENLFHYYQADGSTGVEPLAGFINNEENIVQLSKKMIPKDQEDSREYTTFIKKILLCDRLNDNVYQQMMSSIPYRFTSLDLDGVSGSKIESIITNGKLAFSKENYNSLKQKNANFHVLLLEKYKSQFLEDIDSIAPDAEDILSILQSDKFTAAEKNVLSEKVDESLLLQQTESLQTIGRLILLDQSYRVSDSLLSSILTTRGLSIEQRIRILRWKQSQVPNESLDTLLNSFGEPYSDITLRGKRPLLPMTEYNMLLAEVLASKQYISSFDNKDKGVRINTFSA